MEYHVKCSLRKHSRACASTWHVHACEHACARARARPSEEILRGTRRWRSESVTKKRRGRGTACIIFWRRHDFQRLYITALDKDWVGTITRYAVLHKPCILPGASLEPSCSTAFALLASPLSLSATFSFFFLIRSATSSNRPVLRLPPSHYVRAWYPYWMTHSRKGTRAYLRSALNLWTCSVFNDPGELEWTDIGAIVILDGRFLRARSSLNIRYTQNTNCFTSNLCTCKR